MEPKKIINGCVDSVLLTRGNIQAIENGNLSFFVEEFLHENTSFCCDSSI